MTAIDEGYTASCSSLANAVIPRAGKAYLQAPVALLIGPLSSERLALE